MENVHILKDTCSQGSEAEQEEQSAADHSKMLEGLFGKASPDKARVASRRQPATESVPESQLNLPPVTAGRGALYVSNDGQMFHMWGCA